METYTHTQLQAETVPNGAFNKVIRFVFKLLKTNTDNSMNKRKDCYTTHLKMLHLHGN